MNDFRKQIIHDLAKKYTFENFNFKEQSPEELLALYQDTSYKLEKVYEKQDTESSNKNIDVFFINN